MMGRGRERERGGGTSLDRGIARRNRDIFRSFSPEEEREKKKRKENIGKRDIFGRTNRFLNFSKRASFWERNRSET